MKTLKPIASLIDELVKLPTIGQKTAERLSLFMLNRTKEDVRKLTDALLKVKDEIISCSSCFSICEKDPCEICTDPSRDETIICIVEEPHDLFAIEKSGEYRGVYHVLGGALSPLDGIGPDDLNIKPLLFRAREIKINEVILATNPTCEGEATAMYCAKLLKPLNFKVSRIARGLPVGGDLEYADEATVMKALEGRTYF